MWQWAEAVGHDSALLTHRGLVALVAVQHVLGLVICLAAGHAAVAKMVDRDE